MLAMLPKLALKYPISTPAILRGHVDEKQNPALSKECEWPYQTLHKQKQKAHMDD